MEKKTIIIAATGATVVAVVAGVAVKHFVFGQPQKIDEKSDSKTTVSIKDVSGLAKVITKMAEKSGIDLSDDQVFALTSGVALWGLKHDKAELTGDDVLKAANWAAKKENLNMEFKF